MWLVLPNAWRTLQRAAANFSSPSGLPTEVGSGTLKRAPQGEQEERHAA